MFERTKSKIESIKNGDEKLFENPPKYSKLLTPNEKKIIGQELELYLKKRELLGILQHAGSVDNIQDPIKYRKVFNAIYEFCLKNNISLDDPPETSSSLKLK